MTRENERPKPRIPRADTPQAAISASTKAIHTPSIPNTMGRRTARGMIAAHPLIAETPNAFPVSITALKKAALTMFSPAKRNPDRENGFRKRRQRLSPRVRRFSPRANAAISCPQFFKGRPLAVKAEEKRNFLRRIRKNNRGGGKDRRFPLFDKRGEKCYNIGKKAQTRSE